MICKNCGHQFEGNFCNHCGQKATVQRLKLFTFLSELGGAIFQVNQGFFFTLKALFTNPAASLNAYLKGERKKHFKPIAYALTLSTLYFLLTKMLGQNTWIGDFISGWMNLEENGKLSSMPPYARLFLDYYAYASLLLIPLFSLASFLAFFKSGKNYLEHLAVNAYITGQQTLFFSFFMLVGLLFGEDWFDGVPVIFSIAYNFVVYWNLFENKSRILNLIRTLLTYFLYTVFCVLILGLSELF